MHACTRVVIHVFGAASCNHLEARAIVMDRPLVTSNQVTVLPKPKKLTLSKKSLQPCPNSQGVKLGSLQAQVTTADGKQNAKVPDKDKFTAPDSSGSQLNNTAQQGNLNRELQASAEMASYAHAYVSGAELCNVLDEGRACWE